MELLGFDRNFQPIKTLPCINIQWNRRYYEPGDYQIQLRARDWDSDIAYIYTHDRPETGMVEKIETEHTVKGDFVNASGFFLENMLNWKVTYPKRRSKENISAACKDAVSDLMTDTGVIVPSLPDIGSTQTFKSEGEFLGDALYKALKRQELSQRIRYDYASSSLYYEVWQGLDRTQGQSANTYAAFSQDFGIIDAMTLTQDSSDLRNYAIVGYISTATGNPTTMIIDLRENPTDIKRILYIDTGMSIEDGQLVDDFHAEVASEARKQLADYEYIVNVDANVLQRNLLYLSEYDLGDKCDVRDDRLQLSWETRIIEINEVWRQNEHSVSLQFGDKIPTAYNRR